jgi:hypothetical protein
MMSSMELEVKEPLYSAMLLSLGFYFGQKKPNGNGNGGH